MTIRLINAGMFSAAAILPQAAYAQSFVYTDGTTDLRHTTAGLADSARWEISLWIRPDAVAGQQYLYTADDRIRIFIDGAKLSVLFRDTSYGLVYDGVSAADVFAAGQLAHVYVAIDLAAPALTIRLNGIDLAMTESTPLNQGTGLLYLTRNGSFLRNFTSLSFAGEVSDLFIQHGVISGYGQFADASGAPVDISSVGNPVFLLGAGMQANERNGDLAQGWNDGFNLGSWGSLALNAGAFTDPGVTTAPAPFGAGDWSLTDPGSGGVLTVTISSLPANGGSPVTDIEYQLDAGGWISAALAGTGSFDLTGLADGQTYSVAIRAVNTVGAAATSAAKTAAPSTMSGIALPAPAYSVWDFDDQAVDAAGGWTSTTNVPIFGNLDSAINTAMGNLGTVANPTYHDIVYTGGNVVGDTSLTTANAISAANKGRVFIRVRPQTPYTSVTGEIIFGANISDTKWVNWRLQPRSDVSGSGKRICFQFDAGGKRMSFARNQFGLEWDGGTNPNQYPECIGGGSPFNNCEIAFKDNDCRRIFQVLDGRTGYFHFEGNLCTEVLDDFAALTCRGASIKYCYFYGARNIVASMADDPGFSGYHTDFIQVGTGTDAAGDVYEVDCHQNIFYGDTYRQYPTHGLFIQNGGGNASDYISRAYDNFFAVTGLRGIQTIDRQCDYRRNVCVWPGLTGPLPSSGTGWNGGPFTPQFQIRGSLNSGAAPNIDTLLAQRVNELTSWGGAAGTVDISANPLTALGAATAYDTVFPDLTISGYSNGQVRIAPHGLDLSASQPKAAIDTAMRSFVATQYAMYTPANGQGWEANGFNSPLNWV